MSGHSTTDPSHKHPSDKTDQPVSTVVTDTGSPPLKQRQDSVSSISSGTDSHFSDRPPVDIYAEEG